MIYPSIQFYHFHAFNAPVIHDFDGHPPEFPRLKGQMPQG
jgi:hypothetical protein